MRICTINPATEEVIQEYTTLTKEQVFASIEAAHRCFNTWRKTPFSLRRQAMLSIANLLKQKKKELATLIAMEMGKPITQGLAEIEKCAWVCEHFAEQAKSYLQPREICTENKKATVYHQPLGVVFAIMPWNFPFWQVFRFAAPTLMAGNGALLKHAPISAGAGERIAALFLEAGFPEHLFQHVILDNAVAQEVIKHDKIVAVTLTGSEKTGSIVASCAASQLKKVVMELGGNDPYVILQDADLNLAARAIVCSRLNNTGQVCIAAKRVIAPRSIHDRLVEAIEREMAHYSMGDPLDEATKLGPMARQDLRSQLHMQVSKSITLGAKPVMGAKLLQGKGFYYPPTLLLNVSPGMPAFDEELFGPVVCVISCEDEKQAIALANQTPYGLGAAIFTQDLARGEEIARDEIEAGSCFVNDFVASDPRLPFGGIKHSGFGRELSQEGILEFVNIKTVATPIGIA